MEEDISARMDRERLERKLALDARQFVASTENSKKAQVVSTRRYEDLRRATNIVPPTITPVPEKAIEKPSRLSSVLYYTFREGVPGTIQLSVVHDFEPLP
jgi:hypothetical protein